MVDTCNYGRSLGKGGSRGGPERSQSLVCQRGHENPPGKQNDLRTTIIEEVNKAI